jgi:transcriptional regulator with PAS, ATPase and Fis domain
LRRSEEAANIKQENPNPGHDSRLDFSGAEGEFRQDLFYRLNVSPIRLPALRERISDTSLLVGYLIDRYAKKLGEKIRNIDKKTVELFHAYDLAGNIRELQNVVERAVILSEGETFFVDETWLTHVTPKLAATAAPLVADLVEHEREILEPLSGNPKAWLGVQPAPPLSWAFPDRHSNPK